MNGDPISDDIDFDPVDWITASSIGPPGNRTFYIQAMMDGEYAAVVVEKAQVSSFAELAQEVLQRFGVTVTPDDVDSELELHGPVQPSWRVGRMSLAADPDGTEFVLQLEELVAEEDDEFATARFVMDREQLLGMTAFAAFAVEHGGRERCQVCEGLRDPLDGCMGCPLTNGSGPKRI